MDNNQSYSEMDGGVTKTQSLSSSMDPQLVFCYLVLEEFLMKKNMTETLKHFREEWTRPDDVRFENMRQ